MIVRRVIKIKILTHERERESLRSEKEGERVGGEGREKGERWTKEEEGERRCWEVKEGDREK